MEVGGEGCLKAGFGGKVFGNAAGEVIVALEAEGAGTAGELVEAVEVEGPEGVGGSERVGWGDAAAFGSAGAAGGWGDVGRWYAETSGRWAQMLVHQQHDTHS